MLQKRKQSVPSGSPAFVLTQVHTSYGYGKWYIPSILEKIVPQVIRYTMVLFLQCEA